MIGSARLTTGALHGLPLGPHQVGQGQRQTLRFCSHRRLKIGVNRLNELLPRDIPLLEYDPSPAVIEPSRHRGATDFPERLVMCFFREQIAELVEAGEATRLTSFDSEDGTRDIYLTAGDGAPLALMHPGVGAPFAAMLEEAIACGVRRVIVCGGGGVLDKDIAVGHLLVLQDAVRDEGTSFHYLPPGRRVAAHPQAVAALRGVLERRGIPYLCTTSWTTDAFYRETPAKVRLRRQEGCLCVEMEAAALFAVAQFRQVVLGQLLYAGDDVSGLDWDTRDWVTRHGSRSHVLRLAMEACRRL
jgi:uridine phosphorylase